MINTPFLFIFVLLILIRSLIMASAPTTKSYYDTCDLAPLYSPEFSYSVPKAVVTSFFEGNAFGREVKYSPEEQTRLREDINAIFWKIMAENPEKGKVAVITAGSPGAGKTILLRRLLQTEKGEGHHFAYDDPDDVCLREMERTYQQELKEKLDPLKDLPEEERIALERQIRQDLYNKWRPGSNAAAHIILAHLIRENYSFYFGSTSSSPMTANSFDYLKKLRYRIHLVHVSAEDSVRWESIRERDKHFVQTTEEDIVEKGKLVPQRISDTYLKFADRIDFYYREKRDSEAVLGATWIRGSNQETPGDLTIQDLTAYASLVKVHNAIVGSLPDSERLLWEASVGKASKL